MGTRLAAAGAGVLAIALIVAGCGGSDPSVSTSSLSKAQFIKKADAVCAQGNKRLETNFATFLQEKKNLKHPSEADFEELVGKVVVPNLKREVKELRALGAPSGDEDRVGEIITAIEEGIETAESDPKVAASSSEAVFGVSSRLSKEYGLEVCGSR